MKSEYEMFKDLLRRACTFSYLPFYNSKLANVYELAAFGFYRIDNNKQDENQVKCQQCRISFKLDPLSGNETLEIKDSLKVVLREHHQDCKIREKTENFQNQPFCLNKATIAKYGAALHKQLVNSYNDIDLPINFSIMELFQNQSNLLKQCLKIMLQKFSKQKKTFESTLSLLGWKNFKQQNQSNTLFGQCLYCGAKQAFIQGTFNIFDSHRTWCVLLEQNAWRTILQNITVYSLENVQGEFLKTKGLIKAKQIRNELSDIINRNIFSFSTQTRELYANEDQEQVQYKEGKRRNNLTIDKLNEIKNQMVECLRESVKRVKVDYQ